MISDPSPDDLNPLHLATRVGPRELGALRAHRSAPEASAHALGGAAGGPLLIVAAVLGHASLTTIVIYEAHALRSSAW